MASLQEWGTQASATNFGQHYYFRYTGGGLYILIDAPSDTTDNPPMLTYNGGSWSQSGDFFSGQLLFDIDGSGGVTVDVDFAWGTCYNFPTVANPVVGQQVIGTPYLSKVRKLNFNTSNGCDSGGPTSGSLKFGFGPTPNYPYTHRFYEVVIPRGEIGNPPGIAMTFSPPFQPLKFANLLDSLSGRVLDYGSLAPITNAAVSVAGLNQFTGPGGTFSFSNVVLTAGSSSVVSVTKTNFAPAKAAIPAVAQTRTVVLPDIFLTHGTNITVTAVEPKVDGLFLDSIPFDNEYTARISWAGHLPGEVEFSNRRGWTETVAATSDEVPIEFNITEVFVPSFNRNGSILEVVAVSEDGTRSEPFRQPINLIPVPQGLKTLAAIYEFFAWPDHKFSLDAEFPSSPYDAHLPLGILGDFGFEWSANMSFDYRLSDGEWSLGLGLGAEKAIGRRGRRPKFPGVTKKLKVSIGNKEFEGKFQATSKGTATLSEGITFREIAGTAAIDGKFELRRFGVADLLGPGLSSSLKDVPGLSDIIKNTSVILWATLGAEAAPTWSLDPEFKFKTAELTGKCGLEASYEPEIAGQQIKVFVGGQGNWIFDMPPFPPQFRQFEFKAYAACEFELWSYQDKIQAVFLDYRYPDTIAAPAMASGNLQSVVVADGKPSGLQPINRSYLAACPEMFVAMDSVYERTGFDSRDEKTPLERFRSLSTRADPSPAMAASWNLESPMPTTAEFSQADLPIAENVFPGANPALASRNQELMLLYVADTGSTNSIQFTKIRWTRWDGTNWSVPQDLNTNTQAEFAPQVGFDGNGNALAVWERVADPAFSATNASGMAAQMEIVWSRWNRASNTWSMPVAFTTNSVLDHAPLICGPMSDGSLLATWTRNASNLLIGTNGAGSQVYWTRWNPAIPDWSTPALLVTNLSYRLSQSLAGATNRAFYLWSRDLGGNLLTTNDQQLFYCQWTNSAWGTATQYTSNSLGNRNARVAVSPAGTAYFVWQQRSNLVMSVNLASTTNLIRSDSLGVGFGDFSLTLGPAGNLAVLWQESSQDGADAWYAVFDPASSTWGKDARLFQDEPLECSFAPVWDDLANLTVAYNKVQIYLTNLTVTLPDMSVITITNVPTPGRVDLLVTKRTLIKDLALLPGDFTASGTNFLPFSKVTLIATVRNSGDIAVTNVSVSFWEGNPTNNGVLIATRTLSGWLAAAATNVLSTTWNVSESPTNELYAVIDPGNLVTEFDEANNIQSLSLGNSGLEPRLISYTAQTNGALRVIANVQNVGGPSTTNCLLALRRAGETNSPLASATIPTLAAGQSHQLVLDLPPGTQPPGQILYTLTADDTLLNPTTDTNYNAASFAVLLWIDTDGDEIPDAWMVQHFNHPTGQAGDQSRAFDDADGDGASNFAEYHAGTDPLNAGSLLKIYSINRDDPDAVELYWRSASNKLYTVERAAGLGSGFTSLTNHLLSTPPQNVYFDTDATNLQHFYRVRVE